MTRPPTLSRFAAVSLLVAALACGALTACDKKPSSDNADDVASLDTGSKDTKDDENQDTKGDASDDVSDEERQDALLEYAKCMREQGIDMPDPEFDADGRGGISITASKSGEAGSGPPSEDEEKKVDAADKVCQPIMEGVMGDAPEMTPEEQSEFRDQQLAYAKCMRENGIDMADPEIEFDGNKTKIKSGGPGNDGPSFDPGSDKFKTADAACQSELGEGRMGPVIAGGGPAGAATRSSGGGK